MDNPYNYNSGIQNNTNDEVNKNYMKFYDEF